MLFNWIAEELGARAPPPPPRMLRTPRTARLLRKSVFQVIDCSAPPPHTLPPIPTAPLRVWAPSSVLPSPTSQRTLRKTQDAGKGRGYTKILQTQRHNRPQKRVKLHRTSVHLGDLKNAETHTHTQKKKIPMDHKSTQMHAIPWRPHSRGDTSPCRPLKWLSQRDTTTHRSETVTQ